MKDLDYTVLQVWIGGEMPFDDKRWSAMVKKACMSQNIDYKLITQYDMQTDKGFLTLQTYLEKQPSLNEVQKNVILSDYTRFAIVGMTQKPVLYLDTDFIPVKGEMPSLPGKGIYGMHESWDKSLVCSGLLYFADVDKAWLLKNLEMQIEKVTNVGIIEPGMIMGLFGPVWYRSVIASENVKVSVLDESVCGHYRNQDNSLLIHVGRGVWMPNRLMNS